MRTLRLRSTPIRILIVLCITLSFLLMSILSGSRSKASIDKSVRSKGSTLDLSAKPKDSTDKNSKVLNSLGNWVPMLVDDDEEEDEGEGGKVSPARARSEEIFGPFDYDSFLEREKAGEFPPQGGDVPVISPFDSLTNNNGGATGTGFFTQSETTLVAFGNTVVVGFNDSGSNSGGTNKFTGYAYSTNGGATFTDGGVLPTNPNGDAGDPVMARNETNGRIFFSTLQFSGSGVDIFHSDDNGVTWSAPVQGAPGKTGTQDKEWIAVDNYVGPGNGNVYHVVRDFGAGNGVFFFRSTDNGNTFGPSGGSLIVTGNQGAFVDVGPDHSVYVFWWTPSSIQMRRSTDQGLTFGPPMTVASGLVGGTNGDLGLTGIRQGTATPSGFRSSEFPHAAVNPANGNIYVTYANKGAGADKADILLTQSIDGGATWSAPIKVNDDVTTTDQWQPTIAVTPDGSTLGVFYYSRQEDPANNNLFKYYGRTARISGATLTFDSSFAVSDTPSLPEFGRDTVVNGTYMGDYDRAVATNGAFHVTWADNRNDLAGGSPRKDPNVFYKRIDLHIHVTTTVPAVGSIQSVAPTVFTVNVTDPVDPTTLQANDFTVNGIPAAGFSYTPGTTTMEFTFGASPVTAEGLQTMHVPNGAFTRTDGDPVSEFNGTFRYDLLTLQVTSTTPPFPNGVFTLPGPFTYDVNFNEPIDPASVQASDLQLSGIAGSSVTGVTVLPGNTTARFTLSVPSEGTLTAAISATAITDVYGNPGTAFTADYVVDIGTVAYPTPLLAKNPVGSLVYDPSATGVIGFAGDTDSFTLNVDPNQTITAIVTPIAGLQPSVSLTDPSSNVIGTATAGAAGQNALLQTVPAATGGTYTFTVSGAGGTTGNYSLQVILNAAQEGEGTVTGESNNMLASAQDIDASFINLQTSLSSAQRGAVYGTTDYANYTPSAVPFAFEDISATGTVIAGLTNQDDSSVSIPIGFTFPLYGSNNTTVFVSSNGLLSFGSGVTTFTNADLTTTPAQAAIAPFWDDQHTGGGVAGSNVFFQVAGAGSDQHLTIQWNKVRFFSGGTAGDTLTYQVQLYEDGRIQFNYQDLVSGTAAGNNGGSATVGIKDAGTQGSNRLLLAFNNGPNAFVGTGQSTLLSPPNPSPDFYSFTLAAGTITTLGVKSQTAALAQVTLLDSVGNVIATGGAGSTNFDRVISNFMAPSSGTYYASVTSIASAPYTLVVTRDAALDSEDNNTLATAQSFDNNKGALGAIIRAGAYHASAVAFNFDDISGSGTVVAGLTNKDDTSVDVPIGFNFPFYGVNNTNVFVSSNGLLTFGSGNTAFTNADLTSSPAQAAIAPFWDDQHTGGGQPDSNVFTEVSGSGLDQHLTIQWNKIRFFSGSTAGDTITYQVQLYADGRIQFNYQDLVSGTAGGNNGASATVGVKAAGTQGPDRLLLAFNNGPNAFVGTGKSTLLTQPPLEDWYSINISGLQARLQFETSTPADGPGEFVNNLDPHIELYDSSDNLIASGTPLGDGRNESIDQFNLSAGTYYIRVTSEGDTQGEYFLSTGARPHYHGFNPPINTTGLNMQQAGQSIPVKFSLGVYQGLNIFAPGYPVSYQIACNTFAPIGPAVPTISVPGLNFDPTANQYIYVWQTDKAWAGTCREFDMRLIDGFDYKAKFKFK